MLIGMNLCLSCMCVYYITAVVYALMPFMHVLCRMIISEANKVMYGTWAKVSHIWRAKTQSDLTTFYTKPSCF